VAEVIPQLPVPLGKSQISGLAFKVRDRLLVSTDAKKGVVRNNKVFEFDFQGHLTAQTTGSGNPPPTSPIFQGIEGLAQTTSGAVAASSFVAGRILFLDNDLNLTQRQELDYKFGLGLLDFFGLAWDASLSEHLILSEAIDPVDRRFISAVSPSLNATRKLFEVDALTVRLTCLPKERLIAVSHKKDPNSSDPKNIPAIRLHDHKGIVKEEINLNNFFDTLGNPIGIAYIPQSDSFAVRFGQEDKQLIIVTRKGVKSGSVPAPPEIKAINGFTFFNPDHPSGGQFVFLDRPNQRAILTDFQGKRVGSFVTRGATSRNPNEDLNLVQPFPISSITSGPDAGAFALIDLGSFEIVVFHL